MAGMGGWLQEHDRHCELGGHIKEYSLGMIYEGRRGSR
jgi:hypothetical protein